jgi:hypothetical protein
MKLCRRREMVRVSGCQSRCRGRGMWILGHVGCGLSDFFSFFQIKRLLVQGG